MLPTDMQIDLLDLFGHTRFLAGLFTGWSTMFFFAWITWAVTRE